MTLKFYDCSERRWSGRGDYVISRGQRRESFQARSLLRICVWSEIMEIQDCHYLHEPSLPFLQWVGRCVQ